MLIIDQLKSQGKTSSYQTPVLENHLTNVQRLIDRNYTCGSLNET